MKKKTATEELFDWIKERVPASGTDERLRGLQSELGKVLYEISERTKKREIDQLREAYYKGAVRALLNSTSNNNSNDEFDEYYKQTYGGN